MPLQMPNIEEGQDLPDENAEKEKNQKNHQQAIELYHLSPESCFIFLKSSHSNSIPEETLRWRPYPLPDVSSDPPMPPRYRRLDIIIALELE